MTNLVIDQSQLESTGSMSHLKPSGFKVDQQHDIIDSADDTVAESESLKNSSSERPPIMDARPSPELDVVAPKLAPPPPAEDDAEQRSTRHSRHRSIKRKYDQLTAPRLE